MSRWKKILIAAALAVVVLIVTVYAFFTLYDFNKFKPMIAKAVKDATGRELTIAGNIEFDLGLRPVESSIILADGHSCRTGNG